MTELPDGRVLLAFGQPTLGTAPTWTAIDQEYPNLVTSYTIDRGRQYELDRTDTGRATVSIADTDGILDPTNPSSPFHDQIHPLMQAGIGRYNPTNDTWHTRYRGFVEEYDYVFDPSQKVNRLELSLVDLFELVSSIEMHPGYFGDPPPAGSEGQVFFEDTSTPVAHNGMQLRVDQVLTDAGIPDDFYVVFSGNVDVHETTYSAGESAMTVIAEAADAEFPGVANVFCDRRGRLAIHGRYARFDPAGTAATVSTDVWDYHHWIAGDGTKVATAPTTTAHLRRFSFNYGLSKIINRALASPVGIADTAVNAQVVEDTGSQGSYGIRGWTSQNLIVKAGQPASRTTDLAETKLFAQYYVDNYKDPQKRVTDCAFRTISPSAPGAGETWHLLCRVDIGDTIDVYVGSPGGGGFTGQTFFVEGVREEVQPLNATYDDITVTLDLSPGEYFQHNPFPPAP